MARSYKDLLDGAFIEYYERFRELNALSKENAVKGSELFPDGQSLIDRDRMHKMLSMNIVKRVGFNRYWLDENRAADGKGVLRQRIVILAIALVLGLILGILSRKGILDI